jgi:exodeoxyribonuclease-3
MVYTNRTLKLLTWNINRGGGERINKIAESLIYHQADIIVLTEFRNNSKGDKLRKSLADCGWLYSASSNLAPGINGVLVAAKIPFELQASDQVCVALRERWLELEFDNFGLLGVYLEPNIPQKKSYQKRDEFRLFWNLMLNIAKDRVNSPYIFIGDFNTGKHYIDEKGATFYGSGYINEMETIGYTDVWRYLNQKKREYTWYSYKGNGFRLEHIFFSLKIKEKLLDTYHSHVERENGISDHSILIATLND